MRENHVIVGTNLPCLCSRNKLYCDGATYEMVLERYNYEYKVEQFSCLAKSGIGIYSIHFQTLSRENTRCPLCIAALPSKVADAVFRHAETRLDGGQL